MTSVYAPGSFSIYLVGYEPQTRWPGAPGDQVIISAMISALNLSPHHSSQHLRALPACLARNTCRSEAERIARKLRDAGGKVEVVDDDAVIASRKTTWDRILGDD